MYSVTTNLKVKIEFTLPELSITKILMWNCHVGESAKGVYGMILGRDLLTALGINLKFSDHVIEADYGPFKGLMLTMVDLGEYEFKYLNTGNITPK